MQLIWLSHIIKHSTPLYGGGQDLQIRPEKSMASGDSCNTSLLILPSHAGTHVDAPYHFVAAGKSVEQYSPETWIFEHPHLMECPVEPGEIISEKHLLSSLHIDENVDLVLFRTGFERYRESELYWREGPGLSQEICQLVLEHYPHLQGVGLDCISISSLQHRDEGRKVHRFLLEQGILIFEDVALHAIPAPEQLAQVAAFPLRWEQGDGAPCTMIGWLREY